jgi:hypothetical protein
MPSSVIRGVTYDAGRCELRVEFVTGRCYVYEDVPQELAEAFRAAFAKGVFFNARIRDAFRFRELSGEGAATES